MKTFSHWMRKLLAEAILPWRWRGHQGEILEKYWLDEAANWRR